MQVYVYKQIDVAVKEEPPMYPGVTSASAFEFSDTVTQIEFRINQPLSIRLYTLSGSTYTLQVNEFGNGYVPATEGQILTNTNGPIYFLMEITSGNQAGFQLMNVEQTYPAGGATRQQGQPTLIEYSKPTFAFIANAPRKFVPLHLIYEDETEESALPYIYQEEGSQFSRLTVAHLFELAKTNLEVEIPDSVLFETVVLNVSKKPLFCFGIVQQ